MEGEFDDLSYMDGIQAGSALESTMLNNRWRWNQGMPGVPS